MNKIIKQKLNGKVIKKFLSIRNKVHEKGLPFGENEITFALLFSLDCIWNKIK